MAKPLLFINVNLVDELAGVSERAELMYYRSLQWAAEHGTEIHRNVLWRLMQSPWRSRYARELVAQGFWVVVDADTYAVAVDDRRWYVKDARTAIPTHTRHAIARRYGCEPGQTVDVACAYCGAAGTITWTERVSSTHEFDHVHPVARGGTNDPSNIVLACPSCNRRKHARPVEEFLRNL